MEYRKEVNGVEVINDVYSNHFSNQVKVRYTVLIYDMCVIQSENTEVIAEDLELLGNQILK